jgi:hypothetical protein
MMDFNLPVKKRAFELTRQVREAAFLDRVSVTYYTYFLA